MSDIERPNARIHYDARHPEKPTGNWVTLLTGHGRSGKDFGTFTKVLLSRGFSVLTIDNRGAGASVAAAEFTLADIAEDVAAIWNAEGIEHTALFGISMGGMVAQTLMLRPASKKVTSLVLVSTTADAQSISNADQVPGAPTTATPRERFARYFSTAFVERHKTLFEAFVKEMARGFATHDAQVGSAQQRAAIAGFDVSQRLGEIRVPTLVVHGTEDLIAPPKAAETLAAGIPGAKLHWVEHAGHLLLAEQPRALYDLTTNFLEQGAAT